MSTYVTNIHAHPIHRCSLLLCYRFIQTNPPKGRGSLGSAGTLPAAPDEARHGQPKGKESAGVAGIRRTNGIHSFVRSFIHSVVSLLVIGLNDDLATFGRTD
jgi:hypothetical protein